MPKEIYHLTDKEQETIKVLAEQGPRCGYDFHSREQTAIMSSRSWFEIQKRLEENLKLIIKVKTKDEPEDDERGRRKDNYFLTWEGIVFAISLGIDPDLIAKRGREAGIWTEADEGALRYVKEITALLGTDGLLSAWEMHHSKYGSFKLIGKVWAAAFSNRQKLQALAEGKNFPLVKEMLSSDAVKERYADTNSVFAKLIKQEKD